MPPLPKRKYAKARQGERRQHLQLDPIAMTECPNCRQMRRPHRACPHCGFYRGRQIVEVRTRGAS
jgi:large subunit ribosomal protein L32